MMEMSFRLDDHDDDDNDSVWASVWLNIMGR